MQRFRRVLYLILPLALIYVVWVQRYPILDWVRLRGYTPPAEIAALAEHTTMTAKGRKLFYVNHPELNDKSTFYKNCTVNEKSIVLGCYVSTQGIYLYNVTDPRLSGVQEVTAAHEMLHAAYERLSAKERSRIDALTQSVFASSTDQRLKDTIAAYEERDPSAVPNELHSILGTEVENLPAELESYYSQYFTNRKAIVTYSKNYEAAFSERKAKVDAYDSQLASLKAQIESLEQSLNSQEADLRHRRQELDALLAAGRTSEYNARVPGYNAAVRGYNADVGKTRSLIDQFNKLVEERNAIAIEENELVKAIDSRPDTIPTE